MPVVIFGGRLDPVGEGPGDTLWFRTLLTFNFTGGGIPGAVVNGVLPNNENGGVFASEWFLLIPSKSVVGGLCYLGIYDVTSLDDEKDGSLYNYRIEDIIPDQTPTVNRVILTYRDLGPAKLTVSVTSSNDNGEFIRAATEVQIGNKVPTFGLLTRFVDIQLTGFRPQLSITRKAGDGPLSIVAVTMKGECEEEI